METVDIVLIIIGAAMNLMFGYLTGYAVAKKRLIRMSEERAIRIVENWIEKMQKQELQNKTDIMPDDNFDIQIIEWTLERAIADEDYEEAARLSEILRKMQEGENE